MIFSFFTERGKLPRWALAFGFGAGTLFFAACGRQADRTMHITIWHQKGGPERALFEETVARYNAAHADRVVEPLYRESEELRNVYVIAAVAGQGPDLVYGPADNVGVFVMTQTIRAIDGIFPTEFLDQFDPKGFVEWQGSRWLVADQIGNHLALVYNRSLVPEPPKTLDDLVRIAREQTRDFDGDGKTDQYGLTWNYREPFFFVPFLTAFGGWIMDEETGAPTLDTPEVVKALQFVLDLRDKYKVIPREVDYDVADSLFKEGKSAMIINGPWSWAAYGMPERSMLAPLPLNSETGLPCAPIYSAKGYSVNINVPPEKLPIVAEVVEYFTGAEVQAEMAARLMTSPVNKQVIASPAVQQNAILQASLEQIRLSKPMPIRPQLRQIWDGMRGPYQLIMNGAISAEDGARRMQHECEKNIADSQL